MLGVFSKRVELAPLACPRWLKAPSACPRWLRLAPSAIIAEILARVCSTAAGGAPCVVFARLVVDHVLTLGDLGDVGAAAARAARLSATPTTQSLLSDPVGGEEDS